MCVKVIKLPLAPSVSGQQKRSAQAKHKEVNNKERETDKAMAWIIHQTDQVQIGRNKVRAEQGMHFGKVLEYGWTSEAKSTQ